MGQLVSSGPRFAAPLETSRNQFLVVCRGVAEFASSHIHSTRPFKLLVFAMLTVSTPSPANWPGLRRTGLTFPRKSTLPSVGEAEKLVRVSPRVHFRGNLLATGGCRV